MKRRILSLLLVLALAAGLLPAVQAADSFQLTYKEISDPPGLEITGYFGERPPKLVIPESIDGRSVVSIGVGAFEYNIFEEIVLPDSVKKIESSAFRDSQLLTSVSLGKVESLGASAFANCDKLTQVTLPDTLTEMGSGCFKQTALTEITIPGSVKTIPTWCFYYTPLRQVTICEGVKYIFDCAFNSCPLEGTVILPKSLTYVGYEAFGNPLGLDLPPCTLLCLADTIEMEQVDGDHLIICHGQERPSYLNPWSKYVLFEELPYDPTAETFTEGAVSYCICDGVACVTSCTAAGDYTMPDTLGGCPVGVIGPFAFSGAEALNRLTLPDSITDICRGAFYGSYPTITRLPKDLKSIGEAAFYNQIIRQWACVTFVDGTIPDGITEIPDGAFRFAKFTDLVFPAGLETIGSGAFYGVHSDSITFSGSVREIGSSGFGSVQTDTIELPEGLETIADSAFIHCALKTLYLPHSLRECDGMFGSYPSIDTIVYGYSDTPAYACCTGSKVTFIDRETGTVYLAPYETVQGGVKYYVTPGQGAAVSGIVTGCPRELVIPETVDGEPVTIVYDWAFSTDAVRSVYLPDTVTKLCDMAFIDCWNLEFLRLSDNLESIGESCFYNCPKLKYLYIPASVSSIWKEPTPIDYDTVALFETGTYAQAYFSRQNRRSITLDPDKEYVWEGNALCRIEGDRAILVGLHAIVDGSNEHYEVPDSVSGYPVTAIDADAAFYSRWAHSLYLGRNVESIGEGALADTHIFSLYTHPALTSLPENLFPDYDDMPTELYGFTDTYAEEYCLEHPSIRFRAVDAVPFTDVPEDSWYYPWVFSCYWAGYMNGTSATTFSPGGTTSRAMLVTVLYRMCGEYTSRDLPFSDMDYEGYYYDPVRWAYTNGVVYGTSATTFSPNDSVTREQTAAILYRLGSLLGADVNSYTPLTRFRDQAEASDYARTALMWAVDAGVLQGNDRGELDPGGSTTRAQMAAILMRYAEWLETEGVR